MEGRIKMRIPSMDQFMLCLIGLTFAGIYIFKVLPGHALPETDKAAEVIEVEAVITEEPAAIEEADDTLVIDLEEILATEEPAGEDIILGEEPSKKVVEETEKIEWKFFKEKSPAFGDSN